MSVSEKMCGALGRKMGGGEKKMRPVGENSPHSKGCWVFVYSGRWQSTFDYSTVTSRNPLQLLEHPRFLGGADERPPCCYGLTAVISAAVHVVAKHHENNRGYKQPNETSHVKTSYCYLGLLLLLHRLQRTT